MLAAFLVGTFLGYIVFFDSGKKQGFDQGEEKGRSEEIVEHIYEIIEYSETHDYNNEDLLEEIIIYYRSRLMFIKKEYKNKFFNNIYGTYGYTGDSLKEGLDRIIEKI